MLRSTATSKMTPVCIVLLWCVVSGAVSDDDSEFRDELRALQGQVSALLQRRSEDFKLLEESLRGSLEKSLELSSLKSEVDSLRHEVDRLRGGTQLRNDHVTVQWLSTAVTELRAELTEVAAAYNVSAELQQRQEVASGLTQLRGDVASVRSDLAELRAEQQRGAVKLEQLRGELQATEQHGRTVATMCADNKAQLEMAQADWLSSVKTLKRAMLTRKHMKEPEEEPRLVHKPHHKHHKQQQHHEESNDVVPGSEVREVEERRTRHQRLLRRQVEVSERQGRRVDALSSRVAALESTLAKGQGVDKLHLSVLQLLESVETLENKVDRSLPDMQREVSKVEVGLAQLQSALAVVKEDQDNQRLSVKALAGGQSALQDKLEADHTRLAALQEQLFNFTLGANSTVGEYMGSDVERDARLDALEQRLHRLQSAPAVDAAWSPLNDTDVNSTATSTNSTSSVPGLVKELSRVQREYQSIVRRLPSDCGAVAGPSGLYLVLPGGEGAPLVTSCDQDTGAGGWTVVQRRVDGSQDFNRKWGDYAEGFGSPSGEFWLGNDALHRLTADNCSSLRVDLRDIYGKVWVAEYSEFSVSSSEDGYRLHVAGYRGNASDALDYQNRMQFSAIDSDRDISNTHCAANYEGGWWFSHCQHANLNGRYNLGLTWFDAAKNEWIAVAWSEMKLRRRDVCTTS